MIFKAPGSEYRQARARRGKKYQDNRHRGRLVRLIIDAASLNGARRAW